MTLAKLKSLHKRYCTCGGKDFTTHNIVMKTTKTKETEIAIVVEALRKDSAPLSKQLKKMEITSQAEFDRAAEVLKELKNKAAQAKTKQSEIVDPIKKSLSLISSLFKPFYTEVEELDSIIKLKMSVFLESNKDKVVKLEERFKKGELSMAKFVEKSNELNENTSVAQIRTIQKVKIVSLKKIPLKYMVPDEAAIKADLLAGKVVPGAKLVSEKSIAV